MTKYFNASPPMVPDLHFVDGRAPFRPGRIICVGRNYADHAREMGADPEREPPFFFAKQMNALVTPEEGSRTKCAVAYPPLTARLHHEVELVVAIGRSGICRSSDDATRFICGYAVGVDLTRRDMQDAAKALRRPWDFSKSFDGAAPVGLLNPADVPPGPDAAISLHVNGDLRQTGRLRDMIWSAQEIVAEISKYQPLASGDLIFTGTPAGVGAVAPGETMVAEVEGLSPLEVTVSVGATRPDQDKF